MLNFARFLALVFLLPVAAWGATANAVIYTHTGEVPLKLELAATPEEREKGLMGRTELAPCDGMLFLFPKAARHSFWMKDTPLALDLVFVSATREIVHIAPRAKPYSLRAMAPPSPALTVIELDGGRAARDGIAVGDKVNYALPDDLDIH